MCEERLKGVIPNRYKWRFEHVLSNNTVSPYSIVYKSK